MTRSGGGASTPRRGGVGRSPGTAPPSITPEIRAKVRHIELRTRRLVESLFSGEYHSVFKGRGLEFSDVREYQPGDDVRAIDWNVTARRGHLFVKEYVEERELDVMLVVDVSASERFGTGPASNARLAAELAAILGLAAAGNNDQVGLLLVSDHVERFVGPDSGRNHALRLVLELLAHEPVGRGTRLTVALEYVAKVLRRRSVVFVISDFLLDRQADVHFERALRIAAAEHDVVPIRLCDPASGALPDIGRLAIVDPESGVRRVVDTSDPAVRAAHAERHERVSEHVAEIFRRSRADAVDVRTDEDYVLPLVALFRRRARAGA